jgi:hypothetical protein
MRYIYDNKYIYVDFLGVGCFIAESIVGCGGQIVPPPSYLAMCYESIRRKGGVCIADEVSTSPLSKRIMPIIMIIIIGSNGVCKIWHPLLGVSKAWCCTGYSDLWKGLPTYFYSLYHVPQVFNCNVISFSRWEMVTQ